MRSFLCVIILFFSVKTAFGQDERTIRQMLSGQFVDQENKDKDDLRFTASGPRYFFDVNGDGREESFYFTKEDGLDWLHLFDFKGNEVFKYRFKGLGSGSRVYRVSLKWVNKKTSVAIIHYYEGKTEYLEKRGTSRLYFISFQKGNLDNLHMSRGPHIWDEYLDHRKHYHRRNYKINMFDYDYDGSRELTVKFHSIARVYRLVKGKWYPYPTKPRKKDIKRAQNF